MRGSSRPHGTVVTVVDDQPSISTGGGGGAACRRRRAAPPSAPERPHRRHVRLPVAGGRGSDPRPRRSCRRPAALPLSPRRRLRRPRRRASRRRRRRRPVPRQAPLAYPWSSTSALNRLQVGLRLPLDDAELVADLLDHALRLVLQRQVHDGRRRGPARRRSGRRRRWSHPRSRPRRSSASGTCSRIDGVPLAPDAGDLGDPVQPLVVELADLLHPAHEVRERPRTGSTGCQAVVTGTSTWIDRSDLGRSSAHRLRHRRADCIGSAALPRGAPGMRPRTSASGQVVTPS